MSITRISKKAFAIVAECPNEKKPYGITVDPISDKEFKFVWAFKISREGASREGFDKRRCTAAFSTTRTTTAARTAAPRHSISAANAAQWYATMTRKK